MVIVYYDDECLRGDLCLYHEPRFDTRDTNIPSRLRHSKHCKRGQGIPSLPTSSGKKSRIKKKWRSNRDNFRARRQNVSLLQLSAPNSREWQLHIKGNAKSCVTTLSSLAMVLALICMSSSQSVTCVRQIQPSNDIRSSARLRRIPLLTPLSSSAPIIRVEDSHSSRSRWGVWRSRDVLRAA